VLLIVDFDIARRRSAMRLPLVKSLILVDWRGEGKRGHQSLMGQYELHWICEPVHELCGLASLRENQSLMVLLEFLESLDFKVGP
jgi:hypothetical protein